MITNPTDVKCELSRWKSFIVQLSYLSTAAAGENVMYLQRHLFYLKEGLKERESCHININKLVDSTLPNLVPMADGWSWN